MKEKPRKIIPNPVRGERGNFRGLSITMPEEMIEELESIRRHMKRAREKNADMSSLIREAVAFWLSNRDQKDCCSMVE